ncbi:cytochrome c biogenesis protein ResB [Brevibacillus daliensis]|uniref:cytochrome c biogenesis protein ResB n=1 Tax=Brevibacillus daliensis TaxID=2892995 RepID=UPI001E379862|nr:cytochrome c biogenesis protein ResB [Brevibacillus daliensis]
MSDDRKCECGHTNPIGTVLCESCGKPLLMTDAELEEADNFPSMRYEGMARRSKTYSRKLVDKVWNFFSSVKIAVIIIIITLVMASVGTILPQKMYVQVPLLDEQMTRDYYSGTYGLFGDIYYLLGFHEMYNSWWFVTLMAMIGISLVICSLDRIIPLYKALRKPRINQHLAFYRGQRLFIPLPVEGAKELDATMDQTKGWLKKRGYKIFGEGTSILAEKGRISRWGPYINHVGLIVFLLGVLLRGVPAFHIEEFIWVREGQTVSIPGTKLFVKNLEYKTEYYAEDEYVEELGMKEGMVIPKNFQTDVIIYKNENENLPGAEPNLTQVKEGPITVNHPITYQGISLFQLDRREQILGALNFTLIDMDSPDSKEIGEVKIDLFDPSSEIKVGENYVVRILDYFPDYQMGTDNRPQTKGVLPNNPMVAMEIVDTKTNVLERVAYVAGGFVQQNENTPRFQLATHMPDLIDSSGLIVRKDTMLPLILFGAIVSMIGLVMGFYWNHRRIWIHMEAGRIYVAGHTNKNWFGLKQEAKFLMKHLNLSNDLVAVQDKDKKKNT